MTKFLFWNLNKKPLASIVTNLARQHEVDVIILAECEIAPAVMLKALNRDETQFHFSSDSLCEKIAIYTRFSRQFLKPKFETNRITIRQVLLRPDVMPFFPDESLQILSTDGTTSFLSERGLPNTSAVSDHLPIPFQLDL